MIAGLTRGVDSHCCGVTIPGGSITLMADGRSGTIAGKNSPDFTGKNLLNGFQAATYVCHRHAKRPPPDYHSANFTRHYRQIKN